jgi:hypothetical protein
MLSAGDKTPYFGYCGIFEALYNDPYVNVEIIRELRQIRRNKHHGGDHHSIKDRAMLSAGGKTPCFGYCGNFEA